MQSDENTEPGPAKRDRLWVVTELYYPEETSTGYYLTRIAEGLARDFDIKVLCGQPTYSARGTIAARHEHHKEVEIFRVFGSTLDKNVVVFRLMNMVTLGLSVLFNGVRRFKKGDRILVVTTPPSMPFVVAIASLIKGASYTLLIHDNYPEILIATKKARSGSFFVNVVSFFNRWLYKHAAKIIVVGRDMLELLERKTLGLDVPIVNIPNWAELESVHPTQRSENRLLKELRLQEKLVFLYAGNMGHPNDMETIVASADQLKGRDDLHFVFLGTGAKRRWLEDRVAELGLANVTILDPRPRSEQTEFLNACDVAIVSLVSNMRGVSMPSRTYNILAAGRPILALADEGSEVARVVAEEQVGWITPPLQSVRLTATIEEIADSRGRLSEMGLAARSAALRSYSLDVALEKYRREL